MRVIAGERGGLPLKSLKGSGTRPTSDKVKESIFNIIGPYFNGGRVVELFGGSGALSIEALSRGADDAIIFEKNRAATKVIHDNVQKCRYESKVTVHVKDARHAIQILQKEQQKIHFLFVDPPYADTHFYQLIEQMIEADLLAEDAIIVCEHDKKIQLPSQYGPFPVRKSNVYGNIAITIYEK
ncbi:MAG TPA: 16S rRNA (guanine(966)-N(2))-methyltransferase RsmD [Sporosarcina sp.]|nr:16S rRNA (guanine(966)-N(2))-methyltransferase RsmD [Sporosarcina sp.]